MGFPVKHDVPNMGFLLASRNGEKIAYITDTPYCPYRFKGLTTIMLEVNYDLEILRQNVKNGTVDRGLKNRIVRNHFSLEAAKGFLKANDLKQVREIHLIHLSSANSSAEKFKREVQGITGKPVYISEGKE